MAYERVKPTYLPVVSIFAAEPARQLTEVELN